MSLCMGICYRHAFFFSRNRRFALKNVLPRSVSEEHFHFKSDSIDDINDGKLILYEHKHPVITIIIGFTKTHFDV